MSPVRPPIGPPPQRPRPGAGATRGAPARRGGQLHAPGLVARLAPVKGRTPKSVLAGKVWLPAVLNTATLTEAALHNEYDTLSAGQFSQAAMAKPGVVTQLREIPLDTLTLAYDAAWLVVSEQNPLHVRNTLFAIVRARAPVHLLLTFHPHPDPWPELDMKVTLRQGTRELRPAEHDTRYMTFQVKEWRDASVPVDSSRPPGGNSGRKRGVRLPTTHKLTGSDSLQSLAMEYYGSYRDWRLIRQANGIPRRWGQKTPLIGLGGHFKVGAKVKIPALPAGGGGSVSGVP